jgi:pSer/pThr/pTyr-binding forkhead associated (FHA) protein
MAKLVLLSAGMTGRIHELKVAKTTVGRVEDNMFQIPEPSVSSHHCEIEVRGNEVVVKDLNSTNGTFINGEKISERVLKLGEVLRLGQVEMRLEPEGASAGAAPSAPAPAPAPGTKKPVEQTMVMTRGVSLNELEKGTRTTGFDTKGTGFSKKEDKANKVFVIVGVAIGLVIVGLLVYVFLIAG